MKLPKIGDLQNNDNWRVITMLSVPSKILGRDLLNIIEGDIDIRLYKSETITGGKRVDTICTGLHRSL